MGCENREVSEDFTGSLRSSHSSKYFSGTQGLVIIRVFLQIISSCCFNPLYSDGIFHLM